jgi:hypothetical protein
MELVTMSDTTYNGWSNYATWRINLECVDGIDPRDHGFKGITTEDISDVYDFGEYLKGYIEEFLFAHTSGLLIEDYARAFLSDVNWYEIAQHLIAEYAEEVAA